MNNARERCLPSAMVLKSATAWSWLFGSGGNAGVSRDLHEALAMQDTRRVNIAAERVTADIIWGPAAPVYAIATAGG
jgi:hypothetical protein